MNIQEELRISGHQPVVGCPGTDEARIFQYWILSMDTRISLSFVRWFTIWGVFKVLGMNVREEGER